MFLENYTFTNLLVLRSHIAERLLTQDHMTCFQQELFSRVSKGIKTSTQNKLLMTTSASIMVPLQMEECMSEHIIVLWLLQRAWHFIGEVWHSKETFSNAFARSQTQWRKPQTTAHESHAAHKLERRSPNQKIKVIYLLNIWSTKKGTLFPTPSVQTEGTAIIRAQHRNHLGMPL